MGSLVSARWAFKRQIDGVWRFTTLLFVLLFVALGARSFDVDMSGMSTFSWFVLWQHFPICFDWQHTNLVRSITPIRPHGLNVKRLAKSIGNRRCTCWSPRKPCSNEVNICIHLVINFYRWSMLIIGYGWAWLIVGFIAWFMTLVKKCAQRCQSILKQFHM